MQHFFIIIHVSELKIILNKISQILFQQCFAVLLDVSSIDANKSAKISEYLNKSESKKTFVRVKIANYTWTDEQKIMEYWANLEWNKIPGALRNTRNIVFVDAF